MPDPLTLSVLASGWAVGEAAFRVTLRNRWSRGRLEAGRKKRIFEQVWHSFVDDRCATSKQMSYLAMALVSPSFSDIVARASEGDWELRGKPQAALILEEVDAYLEVETPSAAVDYVEPTGSGLRLAISTAYRGHLRRLLEEDRSEFGRWCEVTVLEFLDAVHAAAARDAGSPGAQDVMHEVRKVLAATKEARDASLLLATMIFMYAGLTLGSTGLDYLQDGVVNSPISNQLSATYGSVLSGSLVWARRFLRDRQARSRPEDRFLGDVG